VLSATRVERYARCPFSYFAEHVLHIEAVATAEREVSRVEIGRLVHELARSIVPRCHRHPHGEPAERRRELTLLAQTLLEDGLSRSSHLPEIFRQQTRRRILQVITRLLDDELNRRGPLTPSYFELAFGQHRVDIDLASQAPLEVPGTSVRLAGAIDRIDLIRHGDRAGIWIIDYKTGAIPGTPELAGGISFQLPLYLSIAGRLLEARGERPATWVPLGARYFSLADLRRFGLRGGCYDSDRLRRIRMPPQRGGLALQGEALASLLADYRRYLAELARCMAAGQFAVGLLQPRLMGCNRCPYQVACRIDSSQSAARASAVEQGLAAGWLPQTVVQLDMEA
jgi:ATP-dependent helicase/DNAse subunit B